MFMLETVAPRYTCYNTDVGVPGINQSYNMYLKQLVLFFSKMGSKWKETALQSNFVNFKVCE